MSQQGPRYVFQRPIKSVISLPLTFGALSFSLFLCNLPCRGEEIDVNYIEVLLLAIASIGVDDQFGVLNLAIEICQNRFLAVKDVGTDLDRLRGKRTSGS